MAEKPHIIIDGYNYILRTEKINFRNEHALWDARERFIRQIIAWRGMKNIRVSIVFDGQDLKGITKIRRPAGISVRFSKAPQKADPLILEMLAKVKNPYETTLITSDRGLEHLAKNYRCKTSSVEAFRSKISQKSEPMEYREKYDVKMSQKEAEEWLKLFEQPRDEDE